MAWWGKEFLAEYSAICPMCHVFIAKNHSWVKKIPRPLAPRIKVINPGLGEEEVYVCADTGEPWYYDARHPGDQERWVVHSYCYEKALKRIDEEYDTSFSDNLTLEKALKKYQERW